jgi:hypothetical protein
MGKPGMAAYLDFDEFDRNPELDQAMLDQLKPRIRPRSDWAGELAPLTAVPGENNVRFLLVHHTATDNTYERDEVADQIRDFYQLHTGPEREWADVAYNFLVDRFGGIWEARSGSLAGAVQVDATGGSQGFAQLTSLIGDHHEVPVSAAAQRSMVALLAWLAHRYRIDTTATASVEFTSRGSDRFPLGSMVTTRTISGHRDLSDTICPGDLAYGLLDRSIPDAVSALRELAYNEVAPTIVRSQNPPSAAGFVEVEPEPAEPHLTASEAALAGRQETKSSDTDPRLPLGATAAFGAVAALVALRRRRTA